MDYEALLELVQRRRSIRRFEPKPVPWETVEKILETARYAPSAGNSQPWEFVVVDDPEIKRSISKNIALKLKDEIATDPNLTSGVAVQPFLYTAPVIIVVCGDPRLKETYPAWMDRDALFRQSLAICIYTIQLAATCFGLATAWATIQRGPTEAVVKELLGIPKGYTVDHIVPIGYPDEETESKEKSLPTVKARARVRKELKEMFHRGHYDMGKYRSDEQVKEFIQSRTVTRIPRSEYSG